MSHLQHGNWIEAQQRINNLIKSNELNYIHIHNGLDDLYGPVGKKVLLSECSKILYDKFEIEACSQLIERNSLIGFVASLLITLILVMLCLHVIKSHIDKTNTQELEQLKNLKSINIYNIESSSTYITEFMEVESHVKKLVSSISTATRMIARSANARRLVHDIRQPLNHVIQELLPLGKIEDAKSTLEKIITNAEDNLNVTISKSIPISSLKSEIEAFNKTAHTFGRKISIKNLPDDHIWIKLPPNSLESSLINFLKNSVEAESKEKNIALNINTQPNSITVEFLDEGPGFPSTILEKLNKGQIVHSNKPKGAGVGLSEIHIALHENGSHIEFSNRADKGARVLLTIPTFSADPQSLKIWHIEDDKYVRNSWINESKKMNLCINSITPDLYQKILTTDLNVKDLFFFDLNTAPMTGYDYAKALAERGATHLYITTAEDIVPESIPFFISGIIGKKAPWHETK